MAVYHFKNRPDREIKDKAELNGILQNGRYAVLSLCRGNEPYVVSLSYGYDPDEQCLYFHCASQGLKMDFIKVNPNVCATIIEDGGYVSGECGHHYRSVVIWGEIEIIPDEHRKKEGMRVLLNHLESDPLVIKEKLKKLPSFDSKMTLLKLRFKEITGKVGR